jgi:hypothetical protein
MNIANTSHNQNHMPIDNRVMNPAIAQQLFRKSEQLKRQRAGKPAALESFPRVIKTITGLWRYREGQKYLEELILVEGGKHRQGFPVEAQDELMFLYQLLLDQHRVLAIKGQKIAAHRPPGTKFTMGA